MTVWLPLRVSGASISSLLAVPFDGPQQSGLKIGFGFKPKPGLGTGSVQFSAGLAVGLAGIPADGALEAGQPGDQLGQFFD
jgi:hypothetical protein